MDPQNSGPNCLLYQKCFCDKGLNLYRKSLLQHAVVCHNLLPMLLLGFSHDKVSFVIVFFSSAYSLCCNRVSSVATDLSLALQQFVLQGLSLYMFYVAKNSSWC